MPNPLSDTKPIQIGNRLIGPGCPVYIVAEISANHRQRYDEAVRLIHAAKASGADAVKLQTYTPDTLTIDCRTENFRFAAGSLWQGKTLYELYKEAYMPWEWQPKLKEIADQIDIDLFSSAYDVTSVDFLIRMNIPALKISSFEIVDLPLIRYSAKTGLPLIVSTGMATLPEIEQAVHAARNVGCKDLVLLKCTSAYPTPFEEMNLTGITHLKNRFSCPCGLSDHSTEIIAPIAATSLGICMIEKHFTLSQQNQSLDKGFSLEPQEFKAMVEAVRNTEKSLGNAYFGPVSGEKENHSFRRSLYAVSDIQAEEKITTSNVRAIRPSGGLPPEDLERLIGRQVKKRVKKGTPITMDLLLE